MFTGMDIHTKSIVCTTLDDDGNIIMKEKFENDLNIKFSEKPAFSFGF